MAGDKTGGYQLYHYDPSLPLALITSGLFLGTTALHIFHMIKHRTWYWVPFVIGGTFQVMGYIFRAISSGDRTALPPYIGQSLLLLLAPALYAASIYMVLGRVIAMLPNGERYSMIRLNWMTKIFVGGDILSFLMQSTGGGILGTSDGNPDKVKFGENVIVGGLFVQLAFFGFFMLVSVLFWFKYHRGEVIDKHVIETSTQCRWRPLLKILFATSGLILIRSVFRVIEYLGGQDGYLLTREMFLYIFDGLLMFLVMVLFNWCFPGSVVRRKIKGVSEEMGSV